MNMRMRSRALLLCLLACPALAQSKRPGGDRKSSQPVSASAPQPEDLSVEGVVAMVEAGISDDVVIAMLRKQGKAFDLGPADMIRLKKAKVSDAVVKVMLDPKAPIQAPRPDPADLRPPPQPQAPPHPPSSSEPKASRVNDASARTSGRFRKMLDFAKQAAQDPQSAPGQGGSKAIDAAGLRNILPAFDPDKPLGQQFPHVALTVLKAPPMWADTYLTTTGGGSGLFTGCFTVQAVVWSDAGHSRTVGPFDWCSPRDVQIQLGPMYIVSLKPSIKERMSGYLTGVDRTDGPRPPATLLPTDRETQELEMKNSAARAAVDLNMENATRLALMFANLRRGMGQTLSDNGDFRVWIVRINQ